MQDDINGLKTLILKENKPIFYVYYFVHQFQLTLLVAKNYINIVEFFYVVSNLVTIVRGSCKRWDAFRDAQFAKIKEELENGVHRNEESLNQEINLKRPHNTHWDHNMRLFLTWFWYSLQVLMYLGLLKKMTSPIKKLKLDLLWRILSFEFVIILQLIKNILGITNEFSIALKKRIKIVL